MKLSMVWRSARDFTWESTRLRKSSMRRLWARIRAVSRAKNCPWSRLAGRTRKNFAGSCQPRRANRIDCRQKRNGNTRVVRGSPSEYHFGNKIGVDQANYSDSKVNQTKAVGSYAANAWGLYDMHG